MKKGHLALIIVIGILVLDQVTKILVKTNMHLGQEINLIGGWFVVTFVENEGMAFGMDLPGEYGKIALTVFRIIAAFAIGWYLWKQTKKDVPTGFIVCVSMVLAGAAGNIFDSVLYGSLFGESGYSPAYVASFLPPEGGYSSPMLGSVVDMLRFKITGVWPDWFPFFGGEYFDLFPPVFNIADAAITISIAVLILFQRKLFRTFSGQAATEEKNNSEE